MRDNAPTGSMQTERLTDLSNARRLVRLYGPWLRFDHAFGWMFYDGKRWRPDRVGFVARRAKDAVATIYQEAAECEDDAQRKLIAKWAVQSESQVRIREMLASASTEEAVVMDGGWDADQLQFNCDNGTLDLGSGNILLPHNPADHITKLAPVIAPNGFATKCDEWLRFLDRIFAGNATLIDFLQRAFGYTLTGSTEEQVLFFLHGLGANGKTTLLRAMMELMGDYATQAEPDLLLARRGEVHPTGVADLDGTRLVVCTEVEAGRRMAESLVKSLTGGDRLKARRMRQDFFEFEPTFKVWLAANHKPEIRGTDHAIWRRIRLVPFDVTIPEEEQDHELPAKLAEERSGILSWALDGLAAWQERGLGMPEAVRSATESYWEEMDVLAGFFGEECELTSALSAAASDLFRRYRGWCGENGESPVTNTAFGLRLAERPGLSRFRDTSTGRVWWKGIGLKPEGLLKGLKGSEVFSSKGA